ncbi:copper homeostasis protein CutC [Arthrobacter castelli]|uniref:copper homeostasis protein CutC n=1 Tax=Arthrobacter castelli TaxID=271431 RepID=UPI00041225E1|nr:copper homeostasis protein CutC [Arthrobacter castelli]
MDLEIAVTSATGARISREGGANRVELCSGLELGGLTPSNGLVTAVVEEGIDTHVLIRPRPGDFHYSADDVAQSCLEIASLGKIGISGIVIGALNQYGAVDIPSIRRLVDTAHSVDETMEITFHRAVDLAPDPANIVEELMPLGFTRVLTSGKSNRAVDGIPVIKELANTVGGRIQIMAGGGIRAQDIHPLLAEGRADAVHLSAKKLFEPGATGDVSLGSAAENPGSYYVTNERVVRDASLAVKQASTHSENSSPSALD